MRKNTNTFLKLDKSLERPGFTIAGFKGQISSIKEMDLRFYYVCKSMERVKTILRNPSISYLKMIIEPRSVRKLIAETTSKGKITSLNLTISELYDNFIVYLSETLYPYLLSEYMKVVCQIKKNKCVYCGKAESGYPLVFVFNYDSMVVLTFSKDIYNNYNDRIDYLLRVKQQFYSDVKNRLISASDIQWIERTDIKMIDNGIDIEKNKIDSYYKYRNYESNDVEINGTTENEHTAISEEMITDAEFTEDESEGKEEITIREKIVWKGTREALKYFLDLLQNKKYLKDVRGYDKDSECYMALFADFKGKNFTNKKAEKKRFSGNVSDLAYLAVEMTKGFGNKISTSKYLKRFCNVFLDSAGKEIKYTSFRTLSGKTITTKNSIELDEIIKKVKEKKN